MASSPIKFEIIAKDNNSQARAGIIKTRHGNIETPYLVPVATKGVIKSLSREDLELLQPQCLLANTYHLNLLLKRNLNNSFPPLEFSNFLLEKFAKVGKSQDLQTSLKGKNKDLHSLMKFNKPIFTDSGGFQAFSLGIGKKQGARKIGFFPEERTYSSNGESHVQITEEGIVFKSIYDRREHFIGPKESMQIQSSLNSDIIMALDECTSAGSTKKYIKDSMERSHRWEKESLKYHNPSQALYGIIHGGWFKDLRLTSTKYISSLPFDGIAIGGSLGKTKEDMHKILEWIIPKLDNRPRHLLGIGWIDDLFECIERGIDTFDCVEMSRIARHKNLYISPRAGGSLENKFRINISKSKYIADNSPIDPSCSCHTCQNYTKAQLRHFYKEIGIEKETNKKLSEEKQKTTARTTYGRLATLHNIHFILSLTSEIRNSIIKGDNNFQKLKEYWLRRSQNPLRLTAD